MFGLFVRRAFLEKYTYRFDFYISLIGSFISIMIQISVWSSLLSSGNNDISIDQMLNYLILTIIITNLTVSNVGQKIADKVNDGSIIADFMRPVNIKYYLWAEDIGQNIFKLLFIAVPTIVVTVLFYQVALPSDLIHLSLFIVSLLFAVIISFHIQFILGLFAFWLQNPWYISWFHSAFYTLFSGSVVPLWFYPDTLYNVSLLLPFRLIIFEPINIFLGKNSYTDNLKILAIQLAWIILLVLIQRFVWLRAERNVTINGG